MRKHLYLITEHENEDYVGALKFTDRRLGKPTKNVEADYTVFDRETGEFKNIGKQVGCGYIDFEDEEDYENMNAEMVKEKLAEIDQKWLDKAGIEVVEE